MRRTSGTGISHPARRKGGIGPGSDFQRAFTLVELLVVVAIIGLVVAVAAVNLMPGDREVGRRETARLALAIENARDTAWFGGRPVALTFDEAKVRRLARVGNAWRPDASRDTALPGGVRIAAVSVNGQPLAPGEGLLFMPDGLDEPFRVALEVRGLAWAVDGDAAGTITVVER